MQREFIYLKPNNLPQLFSAMSDYPDYLLLAGGTDAISDIRGHIISPSLVIDIKSLEKISGIYIENNRIFIGAVSTITDLEQSPLVQKYLPFFRQVIDVFACREIRNRATIGGNIARASPCADFPPILLVLKATVQILHAGGEREVAIEDFFLGPRQTVVKPGELIKGLSIPIKKVQASYMRISRGKGMDLAGVNVAIVLDQTISQDIPRIRIGLGSVAPRPIRALHTEEVLRGHILSDNIIERATREVEKDIAPISDVRASAEYRIEMVKVLLKKELSQLMIGTF